MLSCGYWCKGGDAMLRMRWPDVFLEKVYGRGGRGGEESRAINELVCCSGCRGKR
jgi:hypothetical protein